MNRTWLINTSCSVLLVFKLKQIKTKKCHFPPNKLEKLLKNYNSYLWEGCKEKVFLNLYFFWGENQQYASKALKIFTSLELGIFCPRNLRKKSEGQRNINVLN